MSTQPVRPAGSSRKLLFQGTVAAGEALAVFPKTQNTYSSDTTTIGGVAYHEIRLLLTDTTAIGGSISTLPASVFDDENPAGTSPHDPTTGLGLTVDGLNANEAKITARTWAQNLKVSVTPQSAAAAAIVTCFATALTQAVLDLTAIGSFSNSGLGLNTGLPCLVLLVQMANPATVNLDIRVEIQASDAR